MLKLKSHAQLRAVLVGIAASLVDGQAGAFAHRQQVVAGQDLPVHLLQIAVDVGAIDHIGAEIAVLAAGLQLSVRHLGGLGNHADDIHAEAVHSLVAPPAHHLKNFLPNGRIVPVQVGLKIAEGVQVVLTGGLVQRPGAAREVGAPVVGRAAVFAVPPNVVVPFGTAAVRAAFDEPGVLIGGVIHHQIDDHPQAPGMGFGQQTVEVCHGAEFVLDGLIVADVVAVVPSGGFVKG